MDGLWEWIDGMPVTFTNWEENQPDNWNFNEDCGELWVQHDLKWNDKACGYN